MIKEPVVDVYRMLRGTLFLKFPDRGSPVKLMENSLMFS